MASKKTVKDARPSRHDDLVAELLVNQVEVARICGVDGRPKPMVTVERPSGKGFIDFCMSWRIKYCDHHNENEIKRFIVNRALIVEVKSELETWSAGDVIRQLKGYQKTFDEYRPPCFYRSLGQCSGPPASAMAFYCSRDLTEAETMLLNHEHVIIIQPTWRAP